MMRPRPRGFVLLTVLPALLAAILSFWFLAQLLPVHLWWGAMRAADLTDPGQLLFRHSALPRLMIAPLVGVALGLTGTILQQVLRNPLAEPTTIGTNAGASLALVIATLYAPWTLESGKGWIALAGGAFTSGIVFFLARARSFSPLAIIIAGLIVTLTCNSAANLLMALNGEYSEELFIWQSGSLVQNGDAAAIGLLPWVIFGMLAAFALLRPLLLLDLSDDNTTALGSRPMIVRLLGMAAAIILSSVVVASVGVISFVALAAPALVRMTGARTLRQRLIWAPLAGGSLLWLTDRLVQIAPFPSEIPTGTATALLGAPLLLILLRQLRTSPEQAAPVSGIRQRPFTWARLCFGLAVLAIVVAGALTVGRNSGGWDWTQSPDLFELLSLRAPRVLTALGAGVMLALAGVLMQRMTGNPMAAPEVLGISGGATIGVLLLMVFTMNINHMVSLLAAIAGSFLALFALLLANRHRHFSTDRLLLAGISIATVSSAIAAIFIASGDQRVEFLLAWMSGSTYRADTADAVIATVAAILLLMIIPLTARWLDILPLGEFSARSVGLNLPRVRLVLVLLAAIATGIATLLVGPLSFTGLMAPHLARLIGYQRALPQLVASAIIGGLILVCADWAGRMLIFPWQIPAGLMAAFIGGPYFMALMMRRAS